MRKLSTARQIYNNSGPRELLRQTTNYFLGVGHRKRLRLKYGQSTPHPNKRIYIDPDRILYGLAQDDLPRLLPNRGVISGEWDLNKTEFFERDIRKGLQQRFEFGMDWKDTVYYTSAVNRLQNGESINRFQGDSVSEFEEYLEQIDKLYEDIKENGYDQSSVVHLNIGRGGEWMIHHGNHRTTIAKILNVEQIPAEILYRHQHWQEIRYEFEKSNSTSDLPCYLHKYKDHLDLAEFKLE